MGAKKDSLLLGRRLSHAVLFLTPSEYLSDSYRSCGFGRSGSAWRITTQGKRMSNHDSQPADVSGKNIVETAAANGSFHTLGKALEAAELTQTLKDSGPYTIFAPTDAAFEKLPKGTLDNWLKPENKAELISVLKYHVMPGRASFVEVEKLTAPKMMQGQTATITKEGGKLRIGGAAIQARDITSSNGIIHAIDTVNVPTKQ